MAKAWEKNPALTAAAEVAKAWEKNPAFTAAAEMAKAWEKNPALTAAAEVAKAWEKNPALTAAAEMAKAWEKNPAFTAAAEVAKAWEKNPALTAAAEMAKAWEIDAGALAALRAFSHSPLSNFLTSNLTPSLSRFITAEGKADATAFATGNALVLNKDAALENQIVEVLTNSGDVSSLSSGAIQYLQLYVDYLIKIMKAFVLVVAVAQAVEYVEGKLSAVSKTGEVKEALAELPNDHRILLSAYRVLIRDRVILRSAPDKMSDDLGRLQIGALLEILGQSGNWINVSVEISGESRDGWVYGGFTARIPEPRP
ncbi:SH3 domain-containing protein [Stutzerimonas stutzeri]|uniref:SH3 domain-containing protein n=2 Tax=Stutzerimonas stutzeri TaxID=316 RepID=UPI0022DDCFB6|nr:SH3 domain-containing protein [Stutzerimonas stutzeri]WBL58839.1 SH3 domain-containing protein [Stutzerimonas stutzeri]